MPVATIVDPTKRFELKSLPEGYVVVRRMTHGQKLYRQDMTSRMRVDASRKSKDVTAEIDMMRTAVTHWEFQNLIVEHNLTDATERLLNFKNVADIDSLDGRIAEEISTYIDELNNFELDAEDVNTPLATSSGGSDSVS